MARVRVFLLTFRRAGLLPRALESLRAQTFADWTCEVHNGDPEDPFPGELLARTADPRFRLVTPPRRTTGVEAFNAAHQAAQEPYQTLLEDDNWWEPLFLERMVAALDARPDIELAWSNMRVWEERPDGSWMDARKTVWALPGGSPPRVFQWPQLIQFADMIHSDGATLARSRVVERLVMPADIPVDMLEQVRERQMDFPIMLVPEVLANYSLTRRTFRSTDYLGWGRSQALLGASFLASVPMTREARRLLWKDRRLQRPRSTNGLLFSALLARNARFLSGASPGDWLAFARGCARRPGVAWKILRAKRRFPTVWNHLCRVTAARTEEARRQGFVALDARSLLDKAEVGDRGLEYLGRGRR